MRGALLLALGLGCSDTMMLGGGAGAGMAGGAGAAGRGGGSGTAGASGAAGVTGAAGASGAAGVTGAAGTGGAATPPPPGGGRPLDFYYGPMKLMIAENILESITAFTRHSFGAWDFTAPDPGTRAFTDAGNAQGAYYRHCLLLGGCMEHRIPLGRRSFVGTAYVLELERAVVEACGDRAAFGMFPGNAAPGPTTQVIDVMQHQYTAVFGAPATGADLTASLAYFESHLQAPETSGVSPLESAGRGHCRALLTTNRFLFY